MQRYHFFQTDTIPILGSEYLPIPSTDADNVRDVGAAGNLISRLECAEKMAKFYVFHNQQWLVIQSNKMSQSLCYFNCPWIFSTFFLAFPKPELKLAVVVLH